MEGINWQGKFKFPSWGIGGDQRRKSWNSLLSCCQRGKERSYFITRSMSEDAQRENWL